MARRRKRSRGLRGFTARTVHQHSAEKKWVAETVSGAMALADEACKKGKEIVVRGDYTSDGTFWPDGRGRVVAVCENKRWRRY